MKEIEWYKWIKWFLLFQFGIIVLSLLLEWITGLTIMLYFLNFSPIWFCVSIIFGIISIVVTFLQRDYNSSSVNLKNYVLSFVILLFPFLLILFVVSNLH